MKNDDNIKSEHPPQLFHLGRIVATPGALQALEDAGQNTGTIHPSPHCGRLGPGLRRGSTGESGRSQNRRAALVRLRTAKGEKLWIITEAADDEGRRAATTILLPEGVLSREPGQGQESPGEDAR